MRFAVVIFPALPVLRVIPPLAAALAPRVIKTGNACRLIWINLPANLAAAAAHAQEPVPQAVTGGTVANGDYAAIKTVMFL